MLAVVDFLDSREKAVVLWLVAAATLALIKVDGLAGQLGGLIRTLCGKLALPFLLLAIYSGAVVYAAAVSGVWHPSATKQAVYWFFGTGVVLVSRSIEGASRPIWSMREIVVTALRLTLVVEFVVNLYVFPFWAELFLVPLLFVLIGIEAVAPTQSAARGFSSWVLGVIGAGLLVFFAVSAASDFAGFATRETAEEFLTAPALTIVAVPVLLVVWPWVRWDTDRVMQRWRAGLGSA